MGNIIRDRIGPGPATHNRRRPTIDGAFVPKGLVVQQGGYSTYEEAPGDHKWVYLDF